MTHDDGPREAHESPGAEPDQDARIRKGAAYLAARRAEQGWPQDHLDEAFLEAFGRVPDHTVPLDSILAEALLRAACGDAE